MDNKNDGQRMVLSARTPFSVCKLYPETANLVVKAL